MGWFGSKGIRKLSVAMQAAHLKKVFPDSEILLYRNSVLKWRGFLTPSPLSETYLVEIEYHLGKRPDVRILSPPLKKHGDQAIPHVFSQDKLCLFRFIYKEWNSSQKIAVTIIPWASLWLFFYEIWLATGEWHGGGEHPIDNEPGFLEEKEV